MQSSVRNRGNVILLVVGVLAVMAMVGSVFLMTTRSEQQQASAYGSAVSMRYAAEGQLARIQNILLNDLHIGANGPYSDADDWRQYIDYPSPVSNYSYGLTDPADRHLASIEWAPANGPYTQQGRWPRLTDLGDFAAFQDPNAAPDVNYRGLMVDVDVTPGNLHPGNYWGAFNSSYWVDANKDGDNDEPLGALVDTDGDGIRDARLYPTGDFDANGRPYWAAVRIIDASGLLNINTANEIGHADSWMNQGLIDPLYLAQLTVQPAVQPNVTAVLNQRDPGAPVGTYNYATYYSDYVERADDPASSFVTAVQSGGYARLPYDPADELACRYGGLPDSNSRLGQQAGWSADWKTGNGSYAPYVTTYSASREYARPDGASVPAGWVLLNREKVDLNVGGTKTEVFNAYRRAFYAILPHLASDPVLRRQVASQLAVNLIDYRDADNIPTVVDVYDDNGALGAGGDMAIGVESQPVIAEAWYSANASPDPSEADPMNPTMPPVLSGVRAAVVLYNPNSTAVDLTDWRISCGSDQYTFLASDGVSVPGNGRLVIRSDNSVNVVAGVPSYDWSSLRNLVDDGAAGMGAAGLTLYRPAQDLSGDPWPGPNMAAVPADDVNPGDFGTDNPNNLPSGTSGTIIGHIGRDDSDDYVLVSAWEAIDPEADYAGSDQIGVDLNVVYSSGVPVRLYASSTLDSVAEIGRLLTVGPTSMRTLRQELRLGDQSKRANGRLDSLFCEDYSDAVVPDVSPMALAGDVFTVRDPGEPVFGRVNINTAPAKVLAALPFIQNFPTFDESAYAAACEIAAYRDRTLPQTLSMYTGGGPVVLPTTLGIDWASQTRSAVLETQWTAEGGVAGGTYAVREEPGFASVGEAAMVLRTLYQRAGAAEERSGMLGNLLPDQPAYDGAGHDDLVTRDLRWAYLSNAITVNSDVYVAYIRVQLWEPDEDGDYTLDPQGDPTARTYIAVIDRSNCNSANDLPVVRSFVEIK